MRSEITVGDRPLMAFLRVSKFLRRFDLPLLQQRRLLSDPSLLKRRQNSRNLFRDEPVGENRG